MAAIGPRCLITLILALLGRISSTPESHSYINLLEDQKWQIESCVTDYQPAVTSRMLTLLYLDSMHTRCNPTGRKIKQIKYAIDPVRQCLFMILVLCGDISTNPGPPADTCGSCYKHIKTNQRGICCDDCNNWYHPKCINMSVKEYNQLAKSDFQWFCSLCVLPNFSDSLFEDDLLAGDYPVFNISQKTLISRESHFKSLQGKGMLCIHLNARSLVNKVDQLRYIAESTKAAVIAVTETWFDETINDSEISIENYAVERNDRNREGGGTCLYIKKDIPYSIRSALHSDDLDCKWVDVILPKTKPILLGVCYRPPKQDVKDFFKSLENVLNSNVTIAQECIILGDFNVNVLTNKGNGVESVSNLCNTFNLKQLISDPTRVAKNSSTAIDLIFSSEPSMICANGVLPVGISDHFLTFCRRQRQRNKFGEHKTIQMRSLKTYSPATLIENLNNVDWSNCLVSNCIEASWSNFKTKFLKVIDEIAPVKTIRVKQNDHPWFNNEIRELVRHRDKLLKKYAKTKNHDHLSEFRSARNAVNYKIKKAKSTFYAEQLKINNFQPKKLWKVFKSLGACQSKGSKTSISLTTDGGVIHDKKDVAEQFNNYFTNVAEDLVRKLEKPTTKYGLGHVADFYQKEKGIKPNSFAFLDVSADDVHKALNNLSSNKATGIDAIPARFLKDGASVVAHPLSEIINQSLRIGIVPKDWKLARVTPLHKKGSKTLVNNYRPISILTAFSKVVERLIHDQIMDYFTSNSLIYDFQSGFRPSYSTDSCLIHLTDYIKQQSDKGKLTGMVVLDLEKAFDTVDHSILIGKLKALGLTQSSISWFQSYLKDRWQAVDVGGTLSSWREVKCGVPQGSILGPLLFVSYINDMATSVNCKLLLYADDSALVVSGKSVITIQAQLTKELENIYNWLIDNRLSLHIGKTNAILFGSKRKLRMQPELKVMCNNQVIINKTSVSYLGLEFDSTLSFEDTGKSVIRKVNSRVKFLYRNKKFLNASSLKLLASSLILCHYDYGCSVWYSGLKANLKQKLQTAQNKTIRCVLNFHNRYHIGATELDKLGWLPIDLRVKQLKLCHMYRILNGLSPGYLREGIVRTSEVHFYNTRFAQHSIHKPIVGSQTKT